MKSAFVRAEKGQVSGNKALPFSVPTAGRRHTIRQHPFAATPSLFHFQFIQPVGGLLLTRAFIHIQKQMEMVGVGVIYLLSNNLFNEP